MQKKQNVFITLLTIGVAVILTAFIGTTIYSVNQDITEACFSELSRSSKQLAKDLYNTTDMDRTILNAIATIISKSNADDEEQLCEIMKSYDTAASYVTYVELLRPDNTMLATDGTVRDVSGGFVFETEAEKGAYVSGIRQSTLDSEEKVIRNAVPVIKDGKTIYMLYGVVRLSEFAKEYKTDIYEGNAYVYLEDGDTGDFLLDTWHNSFGNISEVSHRTMLPGYNFKQAISDMKNGRSGDLGFVSRTTGDTLYMHYEPVGVNNWNVIITIEKKYALRESESVSRSLYRMAAVVALVVFLYMAYVMIYLFREYRHIKKIGMEDQITGLQNRNAYDAYINENTEREFLSISCIYIDADGLHEINNRYGHQAGDQLLRTIADALKKQFEEKEIYRIGGDEYVVLTEKNDLDDCTEKMKKAVEQIEFYNYHISYGIVQRADETGIENITKEADVAMLEMKRQYYAGHDRRRNR